MVLRLKTKKSKVSRKTTRTTKNKVRARRNTHTKRIKGGGPLTGAVEESIRYFKNSRKAYTEGRKAASVGHAISGVGASALTAFYSPQLAAFEGVSRAVSGSAKMLGTKKAFNAAKKKIINRYFTKSNKRNAPSEQNEQSEGSASIEGNAPPEGNEQSEGNGSPEGSASTEGNGSPEGNGQPEGNASPEGNGQPEGNGSPNHNGYLDVVS